MWIDFACLIFESKRPSIHTISFPINIDAFVRKMYYLRVILFFYSAIEYSTNFAKTKGSALFSLGERKVVL